MVNVVLLEDILQEVATFVEQGQTDDGLCNTDTLSSEDSAQTELSRVVYHFSDGFNDGNGLARNLGSLHDNFKTGKRVGHDNIDRTNNSGGNKSSC
mmetsp:Transcript_42946/g.124184  ORF Transcript_42946/g.124184 Transcript_42946/m.124184 type:complete len:96 (+) Transcript_42946:80-367(+)